MNRTKNNFFYAAKKAGQMVLTLLVLAVLVFAVSRLAPGDPLKAYYGDALQRMPLEQQEQARERLGLNDSMVTQFFHWGREALRGNFGISYQYKQPVTEVIGSVYQNTLRLSLTSFVLIFVLGLLLAIFCVRHEGKLIDKIICKAGIAANSVPEFFVALILILIFSVTLKWLPQSGAQALGGGEMLSHLVLPAAAIVISHLWYCAYLMRNKLSDEVRKEYILLCRAKGLTERQIIYGHCLRNIMPAAVSIMAIFLPHLLGGAYVIEMVFSYPGLGKLGFESAQYHDYNMLMVICLLTGFAVVAANMTAQVINEKLDPRIREEELRGEER